MEVGEVGSGGTLTIIHSSKFQVTQVLERYKSGVNKGKPKRIAVCSYKTDTGLKNHLENFMDHTQCGCDILTLRKNGEYIKVGETVSNPSTVYKFGDRRADDYLH